MLAICLPKGIHGRFHQQCELRVISIISYAKYLIKCSLFTYSLTLPG